MNELDEKWPKGTVSQLKVDSRNVPLQEITSPYVA